MKVYGLKTMYSRVSLFYLFCLFQLQLAKLLLRMNLFVLPFYLMGILAFRFHILNFTVTVNTVIFNIFHSCLFRFFVCCLLVSDIFSKLYHYNSMLDFYAYFENLLLSLLMLLFVPVLEFIIDISNLVQKTGG